MHKENNDHYIGELREYFLRKGVPEELFLSEDNLDKYVATAVDAYRKYPLMINAFQGDVDPEKLFRMFHVDFHSRMGKTVGIASEDYRSVMMVETPMSKETGVLQYLREIDISSLGLLLSKETIEMEHFEEFALQKRTSYMDDKTWYIYIFATQREFQRKGYGKALIRLMQSFADEHGYRICLETNNAVNVPMYEGFGFSLMSTAVYHQRVDHFVFLYPGTDN